MLKTRLTERDITYLKSTYFPSSWLSLLSGSVSTGCYHRVLKVALTLADLNDSPVTRAHLMESLSYRKMEKTLANAVSS